ncbi:multidrug efflux protein [Scheffersomyces amazonensis]|uniref:multidrug efflux protein n=1 Tax=Scheffersomyces amazonensis TaxID=1078765 RepID=UPI00315D9736
MADTHIGGLSPNEEREFLLETAVNDVYEAVIDDEEDEDLDEDALWFKEELAKHKTLHWIYRPSVLHACFLGGVFCLSSTLSAGAESVVLYQLSCNSVAIDGICDPVEAQVLLSNYTQYSLIFDSLIPCLVSAKIGELSDQYGRKIFIALFVVAYTIQRIVTYYLFTRSTQLPFIPLILAVIFSSLFGGVSSTIALIQSYTTDVVEAHQRIFSIGLVQAAIMIGQGVGPVIANLLINIFGNGIDKIDVNIVPKNSAQVGTVVSPSQLIPLRAEVIVLIIVSIFTVFVFPESRGEKARSKSRSSSIATTNKSNNVIDQLRAIEQPTVFEKVIRYMNIFKPLKLLTYPDSLIPQSQKHVATRHRFVVITMISLTTIFVSTHLTLGQILVQYSIFRFDMNTVQIGYLITILCCTASFMLVVVSPIILSILKKYFKLNVLKKQLDMVDFCMIIWGRIIEIFSYIVLASAKTTSQMYGAAALLEVAAPTSPAVTSALLKFFPSSKTGELFGAIAMVQNVFNVFSPIAMMGLYKWGLRNDFSTVTFVLYAWMSAGYAAIYFLIKKVLRLNRYTNEELLIRSNSELSLASSS